jgi:hypothetical protein
MRGGARGAYMPYSSPCETLAATSSWPNSEALAARVVLAYPHVVFHLCMCGLCRGAAVVAATLIGYKRHEGCCRDDHEEETIVNDYFLYTDARLNWNVAPTLLELPGVSSGNDQ